MSPRVALTVGAAQSFVFGLPLLLIPAVSLSLSGLSLPDGGVAVARGAGAAVFGIGVIDWTLRDATGDVLRALLRGNLVVQVLSLLVTGVEILAGHLPPAALSASAIHAVLCVVFFLALQTASASD